QRKIPYSLAHSVVLPFLKSQGVTVLDQVILTHSDVDHTGTLKEIALNIAIKEAAAPKGTWEAANMQEAVLTLMENHVEMTILSAASNAQSVVGPNLRVLWPEHSGDGKNNDSFVLFGRIGRHTWLFTGDIEKE